MLATTCYQSFAGNQNDFFQYAEEKVMRAVSNQRTWDGPMQAILRCVTSEKTLFLSSQTGNGGMV
ncbi:hypothetical protein O9993_21270 [Vibrio lentus]|nr:hypothetical protein [Vibrio lentus]